MNDKPNNDILLKKYGSIDNNVSNTFTIDDILNSYGLGLFQYKLLLKLGSIWLSDAMEVMLIGFLYEALDDEWDLTTGDEALIGAVVFTGMLIGAFIWGIISDKIGRKKVLF